MGFYVYKGNHPLGQEPLGTGDRMLIYNLKSIRAVLSRVREHWGDIPCTIYRFTDIYDTDTFALVMEVE